MSKNVDIPDDQAAELAALQAGAVDGEMHAVHNAAPDAAPQLSLADELAGFAGALLAVAGPMFPSVKAIYTEDVTKAAAASIAAVCVKHGWLSGGLMGEYAEELTCLMVCGPLAFATVQAAKSDMAKMQKKPAAAAVPPPQTSIEPASAEVKVDVEVDHTKPYVMARG